MQEWDEIETGFETTIETDKATVQMDYFPDEYMAQIYVMHPTDEDAVSVPEIIRFKSRFAGGDEEIKKYDVYVCFWDEDQNGVSDESQDWDIGTVTLKANIEDDENPSENDKKVFEFLENHALSLVYEEELESAQEEGFLIEEVE